MAVVTQHEFGLFIGGELVEPASGEIREPAEPATGEPLARVAMAGEAVSSFNAELNQAVDNFRFYGSAIGPELGLETLELYLETKSVLASTSAKPFNPFGL